MVQNWLPGHRTDLIYVGLLAEIIPCVILAGTVCNILTILKYFNFILVIASRLVFSESVTSQNDGFTILRDLEIK